MIKESYRKLTTGMKLKGILPNDILIASFPKTGSTLTRFIFSNLINIQNGLNKVIDFYSLGDNSPECMVNDLRKSFPSLKGGYRVIKTHGFFSESKRYKIPRTIYIVRDPRDVMISYYHYAKKRKKMRYEGAFEDFIMDQKYGIYAYNEHVKSWIGEAKWVIRYEDLISNPYSNISKILEDIGYTYPTYHASLSKAILYSKPETVKDLERKKSRPGQDVNFDSDFKFVRDGSVAQWKNLIAPELSNKIMMSSSGILRKLYEDE